MSNFQRRSINDFIGARGSQKTLMFNDVVTNPEAVSSLFRMTAQSGGGADRRRSYDVFRVLNSKAVAKPDYSALTHQYSEIVNSLFVSFIDEYGKYSSPRDLVKVTFDIRVKLGRAFKSLLGVGNVNIIFKNAGSNVVVPEKLSFFFNESYANVKLDKDLHCVPNSTGAKFSEDSTLTIIVPIKYIETLVNSCLRTSVTDLAQSGIRMESTDPKMKQTVIAKLYPIVTMDIINGIYAGIYSDTIFSQFSASVTTLAKKVIRANVGNILNVEDTYSSITNLNLANIKFLTNRTVSDINPYIIMDILEGTSSEVTQFVKSMVRSGNDEYREVRAPKRYLLKNKPEVYVDQESAISSALLYTNKLLYTVIALMLTTKNTIKESTRATLCREIRYSLNTISSQARGSMVSMNKIDLIREVEHQLDIMEDLASDIIKLKRFVTGDDNATK